MKKVNSWALVLAVLAIAINIGALFTNSGTTHPAHSCTGYQYTMQCALGKVPAPGKSVGVVSSTKSGIDFAWSCPSPAGHGFGASYFSPDVSKNWTLSCVRAYHAAGAGTVGVYESSANRATQGFSAGFSDAVNGRQQARAVGEPDNRPIDYATDCDCTGLSILAYYQGADAGTASILHISHAAAVNLVGIYGGYNQVSYVFNHGAVGHTNWQTYAWSSGQWLPASIAPLRQVLNGAATDADVALLPDYGQWPYKAKPVVPPGPTPAQVRSYEKARDSSLRAYHARGCTKPVLGSAACSKYASRVVYFQVKTKKPVECWGRDARKAAPVCQIVRSSLSIRSHARAASFKAYDQNNCAGPASWGGGVQSPLCDRLRQRENYFLNLVAAEFKQWS